MSDEAELTKIVVDLPNHWATGGESMWARPLGDDLYELHNVPFYAYGLSFLDVVRATEASPELKPEIRELVRSSGHRTLRVHFTDHLREEERPELLRELNRLHASFEGANRSYFAVDVDPEGDYGGVCERLAAWEEEGLLEYETCEARVPGSFDAAPGGDD